MKRTAFILTALLTARLAAQQDTDAPEELAGLRAAFQQGMEAGDRAVHQQFAAGLAAEEKALAAAGDYAGAGRLRTLRDQLLSTAGAADGRGSFQLDLTRIKNKGSGLATPEGGSIMFSSSGAFLEWELSGTFSGWYEVFLTHGAEGEEDRTAAIKPIAGPLPPERLQNGSSMWGVRGLVSFDKISTLARGDTALHRDIVSTGGWNTMRRVSLGRVEITGNLLKCRLSAREVSGRGLMNFRLLEMVPSTAPAPAAADTARELDTARKMFDDTFRTETAEANRTYRDSLKRMAEQEKDPDTAARIRRELLRLDNPAALALASDSDDGTSGGIVLPTGSGFDWKLRGDVRLDTARKVFTNLRPAGTASITWRLAAFAVPSGTYEVVAKGRVPINGGGQAKLTAGSGEPLLADIDPVLTPAQRNQKPGLYDEPPQPRNFTYRAGKLVIPKGAADLTLTVPRLTHADGSLMELSSITLYRTGDVPAPK